MKDLLYHWALQHNYIFEYSSFSTIHPTFQSHSKCDQLSRRETATMILAQYLLMIQTIKVNIRLNIVSIWSNLGLWPAGSILYSVLKITTICFFSFSFTINISPFSSFIVWIIKNISLWLVWISHLYLQNAQEPCLCPVFLFFQFFFQFLILLMGMEHLIDLLVWRQTNSLYRLTLYMWNRQQQNVN